MSLPAFAPSRPIVIVPYRPEWVAEYEALAARLCAALGPTALRVDHIGSTSVPGLAAKDIVDIQVTVARLDDPDLAEKMRSAGFAERGDVGWDSYVGIEDTTSPELRKRYFREQEGARRAHVHVREQGRLNQRYALLFRDYLRASPVTREAYQLIKERLAAIFPESVDGYLYIKDPLMDLMFAAAAVWAEATGWEG